MRLVEVSTHCGYRYPEKFFVFPMAKGWAVFLAYLLNYLARQYLTGRVVVPRKWKVVEDDYALKAGASHGS